jgi:osmotically inducible lipoprotein OsmB
MRLDFRTIELRGRSSEFDALLNTLRLSDGTLLRVDDDGEVQERNRDSTPLRNGAIGAAVGAIIGAIAGGGKGAVVGAVVGGAGGAILSRGHEPLDLPRGTEVTQTVISRDR